MNPESKFIIDWILRTAPKPGTGETSLRVAQARELWAEIKAAGVIVEDTQIIPHRHSEMRGPGLQPPKAPESWDGLPTAKTAPAGGGFHPAYQLVKTNAERRPKTPAELRRDEIHWEKQHNARPHDEQVLGNGIREQLGKPPLTPPVKAEEVEEVEEGEQAHG